jgi:two-component system cell cycle sensor histidine kinase/response regulator CckA
MISETKMPIALVVDDESLMRWNLRDFFQGFGFKFLEADNGASCLEILKKVTPDLLILDLQVKEESGLDLLPKIKEFSPDIPIITLSGMDSVDDAVKSLKLGAWYYFLKPIDQMTLFRHTVEKALESTRLVRENRICWSNLQKEVDNRTVELEQANQALRESEEKYRSLVENLSDVIFNLSPDGIVLDVSAAIEDYGRYDKNAEIGKHVSKYFAKKDELLHGIKLLNKAIQNRKNTTFEFLFHPESGDPFPVEVIGKPLIKDNKAIAIQCSMRNISERKLAEEEKQELQEQLRQAQKMEAIGTLSGGIAHDFNNLLTVINGHAEISLMRLDEAHYLYKDLQAILQAGQRAESLTRQLLAFGRKQEFEPEVLDVNQVITSLEKMLRRLIGEDICVEMKLTPDIPKIKGDPGQIEQILLNLILNARDAVRDRKDRAVKKVITIETHSVHIDKTYFTGQPESRRGLHVMIAVSDSGTGMDAETRKKIFEPFFTTKEKGKGTGLGLSTVYGIVKQNKGTIDVYSEPGHGTTFKIYWPSTIEKKAVETFNKAAADTSSGNETILFVEDEDAVRNFACRSLRRWGYSVYEASNGKKALELIKGNNLHVDLLITDLIMPEMDGMELAEKIGEIFPTIEILYASGYTSEHLLNTQTLIDAVHFIRKPFSVQALVKKVREILDNW